MPHVIPNCIITKFRKDKPPAANKIIRDVKYFQEDLLANIRKDSCFLKRIRDKMAADRKRLEETLRQDQSSLHEQLLKGLESKLTDSFSSTLKQKNDAQLRKAQEVQRNLMMLKGEVKTLKNQLTGGPTPLLEKIIESNSEQNEEAELLDKIVAVSKETISKLESEAKEQRRETIQSITQAVERTRKDIQKELNLLVSASERSEKYKGDNASLIPEVESIEKRLLDTCVLMNRHRFEKENLQKVLDHFSGKFKYVATKIHAFWEQKSKAYKTAAGRLENSKRAWNSTGEQMTGCSSRLSKQSKDLSAAIDEMQRILRANKQNGFFSLGLKLSRSGLGNDPNSKEAPLIRSIEHFNRMFEEAVLTCEKARDKLSTTAQSSDDFDKCRDLIVSILDGYNTFSRFFAPALDEASNRLCRNSKSGRGASNNLRPAVMRAGGDQAADDGLVWHEIRQELDREYRGADIGNIICVLKDVMKTAVSRENPPCEGESACGEKIEANDLLGNAQNDALLFDQSRISLVCSDDSSEAESMVTCVE